MLRLTLPDYELFDVFFAVRSPATLSTSASPRCWRTPPPRRGSSLKQWNFKLDWRTTILRRISVSLALSSTQNDQAAIILPLFLLHVEWLLTTTTLSSNNAQLCWPPTQGLEICGEALRGRYIGIYRDWVVMYRVIGFILRPRQCSMNRKQTKAQIIWKQKCVRIIWMEFECDY